MPCTPGPLEIEGAPDLIVQMLDKLVDNAVDFSPPGPDDHRAAALRGALTPYSKWRTPDRLFRPMRTARLFESLWQSRAGSDHRPHFGLGLYIVKLIAEFHGGLATAEESAGASGRALLSAPEGVKLLSL